MPPDFLVAGMMKSGTTTLHRWLEAHPSVTPCTVKEPHFYSHRWERGATWYASLFPEAREGSRTFESSQSYSDPDLAGTVADRLLETAPGMRLVFVLRHPIARARSEYRHQVVRGRETRDFTEALRDPEAPYLRRSLYRTCLDPFLRSFPRERLIFLRFEDLVSPDDAEWRRLLAALGLPPAQRPAVRALSTREGRGWRPITRGLVALGGASAAKRVPKGLRKLLRPLFLDEGPRHRSRLASADAELPEDLERTVWEDVSRMESWLGGGPWWERRP